ncbi:MAG: histidine kinase [Flavobacteriales bacterium]|nr:histidine kinase [Flavobacteriales bacterium]MBK9059816.1 histidine kinase [Flavobacteriales bacterium]MBK9597699.1 histidine kinase [Flavobacteriales bacterium]
MSVNRRNLLLYWTTQLVAWTGYMLLLGLPAWMEGSFSATFGLVTLAMVVIGIASSHALRLFFKEWHWLDMSVGRLFLRMVMGAVALGAVAGLLQAAMHDAAFQAAEPLIGDNDRRLFEVLLSWVLQLFVWSLFYVAYHYIVRSRIEELRALRLEAANREGQLSNLRSQLNPHFMFNALNSIRALIEEDPERAKRSITLLSAILRNAMSTVKRRTVPLGEEIDMVRSYLQLESMRYEERLRVHFDVDPALERHPVPPMMLQTLVENAVRHGIAKLKKGGDVHIGAHAGENGIVLTVRNTGHYNKGRSTEVGIGLRNTEQRLEHLYGRKASLRIRNEGDMVVCEVHLPLMDAGVPQEVTE